MSTSPTPEVSVVMAVFNGARDLPTSIESILLQEGVDLEFVIVDDGSTDGSSSIIAEFEARDPRITVLRQSNQGLTKALIRGCEMARGEYLARQDADNVSSPRRLYCELNAARKSGAILVSCGTRFVGPNDEFLYDAVPDPATATTDLQAVTVKKLRGPSHHGSTLFHAGAYREAGGYRPEFLVAQDVDLWVRLAEIGKHIALTEVLQQARISLDGISSGGTRRQVRLGQLILASAARRRAGQDDRDLLDRAFRLASRPKNFRLAASETAYFVGMSVKERDPAVARRYFLDCIRAQPLHAKAWIRLAQMEFCR